MRLLYSKKRVNNKEFNQTADSFDIVEFVPSFKAFYMKGENPDLRTTVVRCFFQIMTFGKAKLVCAVNKNGDTVHASYVVPRCFKFSFLGNNDYIIGPCFTRPDHRGQGIYSKVLEYICSQKTEEDTIFYMCVDDGNLPSVKGIEKAGFKKCGVVHKTRVLKRYYLG